MGHQGLIVMIQNKEPLQQLLHIKRLNQALISSLLYHFLLIDCNRIPRKQGLQLPLDKLITRQSHRIDDYHELLDWSARVYGDARIKLIEEAIYHGGPPTFQLLLASIYENGLDGVNVDYEKALEWFESARYGDGLAVDGAIDRVKEKIEQQP